MGSHYTDRFLRPAAESRPRPNDHGHGRTAAHDDTIHARARTTSEAPVMKINWKLLVAVVLIAAGATGLTLNKRTRGQVVEVWKQIGPGVGSCRGAPSGQVLDRAAKPKSPWDRTVTLDADRDQGHRPGDGRRARARPSRRSCRSSARPTTTRPP